MPNKNIQKHEVLVHQVNKNYAMLVACLLFEHRFKKGMMLTY